MENKGFNNKLGKIAKNFNAKNQSGSSSLKKPLSTSFLLIFLT